MQSNHGDAVPVCTCPADCMLDMQQGLSFWSVQCMPGLKACFASMRLSSTAQPCLPWYSPARHGTALLSIVVQSCSLEMFCPTKAQVGFICIFMCTVCASYLAWLTKLAGIAERRYNWLRKRLKSRELVWAIFPEAWRVPQLLCLMFCQVYNQLTCLHTQVACVLADKDRLTPHTPSK